MNIALFLAEKIQKTKTKSFSSLIIKVGILSISIAMAVLIVSFSVLFGFKNSIKKKLFSISSHIQINKITLNRSFEEATMSDTLDLLKKIQKTANIKSISKVALKSVILKSEEEITGVVFKGIDGNYDWNEFKSNLIEGRGLLFSDSAVSNEIIISSKLCNELDLKLNDDLILYFIQNPPRARKLKIVGIYDSKVEELDQVYVIGDLKLVQKINNWGTNQFGHYEVFINNFNQLDETKAKLLAMIPQEYQALKVTEILPQFFDWFNLLDRNIVLVIVLIIVVAAFNMISVLMIMIMERTPMIGLLKSVGTKNFQIINIFLYNGAKIIVKGLFWGNLIGLGVCFIQQQFKIIKLDPTNYYMTYVPIEWNLESIIFINIGVFSVVLLILLIPSAIIRKINPVTALKYKD